MTPEFAAGTVLPEAFHPVNSLDYLPRQLLGNLQSTRLRQTVARAYQHFPLFRQRMHKQRIAPEDIRSVDDIARLPFTSKNDLVEADPEEWFAAPSQMIVRYQTVTLLPGKVLTTPFTAADLQLWRQLLVRCLATCGLDRSDVVLLPCGRHLCADASMLSAALEALGAAAVLSPAAGADQLLPTIRQLGVSAICTTPSHLFALVEQAERRGAELRGLPLRLAVLFGEPISQHSRQRIEQAAEIKVFELFGLDEVFNPGLAGQCPCGGLHILEDQCLPEVVDPASGNPLPDGQPGELVLSTLCREAMPLVRYRTGVQTALTPELCPCGRTLRCIQPIAQQGQQLLNIQGVCVWASQIEAVLLAVIGAVPPYRVVPAATDSLEQVEMQVEVTPQVIRDQVGAMETLHSKLTEQLAATTGVALAVRFVEPHTVQRQRS